MFQVKWLVILAIMSSVGGYITVLKTTVSSQKGEILTLEKTVTLQNTSIKFAEKEREVLQRLIDSTIDSNEKVKRYFSRWKTEVAKRFPVNTCDEALNNVKDTATKLATEWNSK